MNAGHNLAAPALSDQDRNKLRALLEAPQAKEALLVVERQRAERRVQLQAEAKRQVQIHETAAMAARQAAEKQRPQVEKLYAQYLAELGKFYTAERQAGDANDAAERTRSRLLFDLRELGGEAVDRALSRIWHAERQAAADLRWDDVHDWRGNLVGVQERGAPAHRFGPRCQQLRKQVEALRLSDLSPAEIELRCDAAIAEAENAKPVSREPLEKAPIVVPPRGLGVA